MHPANRCNTSSARSVQPNHRVHTDPDGRYRRSVSTAQPSLILTTNDMHTRRMVSRKVPSGTDQHPCASQPTDHGVAGASHLCSCPIPTRRMVSPKRPNRGNPTLLLHTPTAWYRRASRSGPTCTRVQIVVFSQIIVSPGRPICARTASLWNIPTL